MKQSETQNNEVSFSCSFPLTSHITLNFPVGMTNCHLILGEETKTKRKITWSRNSAAVVSFYFLKILSVLPQTTTTRDLWGGTGQQVRKHVMSNSLCPTTTNRTQWTHNTVWFDFSWEFPLSSILLFPIPPPSWISLSLLSRDLLLSITVQNNKGLYC